MGSTDVNVVAAAQRDQADEEACLYALQLATFSVLPMTLKAAIELDLLEILVAGCGGPFGKPVMTAIEVTSYLQTNNPQAEEMVDRMLRLLTSYNVVNCAVEINDNGNRVTRCYGPAPVCKWLTKKEDSVSIAPLLLMNQDKVLMESWYYLKDAVLDGGVPFNKAYAMTAFEYNEKDSRLSGLFNEAMRNHSVMVTKKFLEIYKGFDAINTLVDIGGGVGATIGMIISKHSKMQGINFDLPHVIAAAPQYPRVEHIRGNMFESVPTGEAILLKWIMHDWSDEHCVKILKNCNKALPDNGKLIILETVIPTNPNTSPTARGAFHGDLIMMAYNPGGKERTEHEFKCLADDAGFSRFKSTYIFANTWALELSK